MPKKTEITCDGCGADLTHTGNSVDYRLALVNERLPSRGGFVTDMMKHPLVPHDHYFCGLGCLDHWRDREHYRDQLWSEENQRWKELHGTQHAPGMWSYPGRSSGERESLAAQFAAAALERFPLARPSK